MLAITVGVPQSNFSRRKITLMRYAAVQRRSRGLLSSEKPET